MNLTKDSLALGILINGKNFIIQFLVKIQLQRHFVKPNLLNYQYFQTICGGIKQTGCTKINNLPDI